MRVKSKLSHYIGKRRINGKWLVVQEPKDNQGRSLPFRKPAEAYKAGATKASPRFDRVR